MIGQYSNTLAPNSLGWAQTDRRFPDPKHANALTDVRVWRLRSIMLPTGIHLEHREYSLLVSTDLTWFVTTDEPFVHWSCVLRSNDHILRCDDEQFAMARDVFGLTGHEEYIDHDRSTHEQCSPEYCSRIGSGLYRHIYAHPPLVAGDPPQKMRTHAGGISGCLATWAGAYERKIPAVYGAVSAERKTFAEAATNEQMERLRPPGDVKCLDYLGWAPYVRWCREWHAAYNSILQSGQLGLGANDVVDTLWGYRLPSEYEKQASL